MKYAVFCLSLFISTPALAHHEAAATGSQGLAFGLALIALASLAALSEMRPARKQVTPR